MRVISQRYPDIRIEGENYLPQPIYRHIASFLSVFKLVLIGLIIVGKDPFAFLGMQAPSIWQWGQENKVYACMMVFFLSNMIENQCMSTGAFEITLNDVPVWSKLESGHLPSMQQLVQILDNEMKLNVHMDSIPHHRSYDTKEFCKSSVTDIMKACTEDSKLLVQTRCSLAGSLYLLENLSARQFSVLSHAKFCTYM
ncbi:Thioredoxin reductase-like selenoprotein T [Apodemus speciosus]